MFTHAPLRLHRYDVIGGLTKQIQEIKEVIELPIKHPQLFEALGVAQPKVRRLPALPLWLVGAPVRSYL